MSGANSLSGRLNILNEAFRVKGILGPQAPLQVEASSGICYTLDRLMLPRPQTGRRSRKVLRPAEIFRSGISGR